MQQGRKQQRGAALVIVMALLTGAMVVGVSGMQSTLVDERLSGNYSASVQAQMNAEQVAMKSLTDYFNQNGNASFINDLEDNAERNQRKLKNNKKGDYKNIYSLMSNDDNLKKFVSGECGGDNDDCFSLFLKDDSGSEYKLLAVGAVISKNGSGDLIRQHLITFKITPCGNCVFNGKGIVGGEVEVNEGEDEEIDFKGDIYTSSDKGSDDDKDINVNSECDDEKCIAYESDEAEKLIFFDFGEWLSLVEKPASVLDFESIVNVDDIDAELKDDGCYFAFSSGVEDMSECDYSVSRSDGVEFEDIKAYVGSSDSAGDVSLVENSVVRFTESVDFDDKVNSEKSTLYHDDDVLYKDGADLKISFFYADGDFEVKGSDSSIDGSIIYINGELDIDAPMHIKNSIVVVDNEIDIGDDAIDGMTLENSALVSSGDIKAKASNVTIDDLMVLAGGDIDFVFDNVSELGGGWFYSDNQLGLTIKNSPDLEVCGGLLSKGEVTLTAKGGIEHFYSSRQGDCKFDPEKIGPDESP